MHTFLKAYLNRLYEPGSESKLGRKQKGESLLQRKAILRGERLRIVKSLLPPIISEAENVSGKKWQGYQSLKFNCQS